MQRALALGALQRRRDLRWDERLRITQPSLATQVQPAPRCPLLCRSRVPCGACRAKNPSCWSAATLQACAAIEQFKGLLC